MKILGISTATKVASVAVIDDVATPHATSLLAEFTSAEIKSEDIIVLIDRICKDINFDIKNIDAIAVATGPGSYSGLRGGLAAAKSLAQVLNVPLAGVSTLEAIAYNFAGTEGTIAVVLDAVRDENNFALFTSDSKTIRRLTDDMVVSKTRVAELLSGIKGNIRVTGPSDNLAYGKSVAMIGLARIKCGKTEDYLSLVPEYSHMPNIREYKK